jgi:hypothetical protein
VKVDGHRVVGMGSQYKGIAQARFWRVTGVAYGVACMKRNITETERSCWFQKAAMAYWLVYPSENEDD